MRILFSNVIFLSFFLCSIANAQTTTITTPENSTSVTVPNNSSTTIITKPSDGSPSTTVITPNNNTIIKQDPAKTIPNDLRNNSTTPNSDSSTINSN